MASETFIGPLLRVSLFQGLSQAQLAGIARRAERVMFRIGQTMIRAGEPGDGAFLLIVGEGSIQTGNSTSPARDRALAVVETGSLIGEMSMLIDTDYGATIVAKTAVRALKITRAALYAQMERDPDLAAHFVAKIASRLRDFTDELRAIEGGLDPSRDDQNSTTQNSATQNSTTQNIVSETITAIPIAIPGFSGRADVTAATLQRAG